MAKAITKVVYKPDTQSTDEFIAIVHPAEYKKWKDGDTSIPLSDVVDSFDVFFSNQGSQGILGRPSRQQLENVFKTSKDTDVIARVLQMGREQPGNGFASNPGSTNLARSSAVFDGRGKGATGI